jgi:hypothetical protein
MVYAYLLPSTPFVLQCYMLAFYIINWDHRGGNRMVIEFTITYVCNQYLSPLKLWVQISLRRGVLDTTWCDQVCQLKVMVFKATFNNISVISWQSVLLVEETEVPRENHWPAASHWHTLSHSVVSSAPRHERGLFAGIWFFSNWIMSLVKRVWPKLILIGSSSTQVNHVHRLKVFRLYYGTNLILKLWVFKPIFISYFLTTGKMVPGDV